MSPGQRCIRVVVTLLLPLTVPLLRAHPRHPAPTPEEIAWSRSATQIRAALKAIKDAPPSLPPAPAGVTDVSFSEIFEPTVGPRGLEYSAKIRTLDHQRIRIVGYMVKQQAKVPGLFLFAPLPISTDEAEYGQCDDLPAATLHVFAVEHPDRLVPLRAGRCVLTGRLELGSHAEIDGRNSVARLFLDPELAAPTAGATAKIAAASATR